MAIKDKYGRKWELPKSRLCPVCKQPDDYSDCNHKQLSIGEVRLLGGTIPGDTILYGVKNSIGIKENGDE